MSGVRDQGSGGSGAPPENVSLNPKPCPLSPEKTRRYARHILLPEIGDAGQQKLLAAKILVVGAGGLGSAAISYLAAGGIGTIGVVDHDRVELSNLGRQILHETGDIGRAKTASAGSRVEELNPDVKFIPHPTRLEPENAHDIISAYDLVIDGCDNFPTRFLVAEICYALGKPLVSAAIKGFTGQISTFTPHLGAPHPCYRCLVPEIPPDAMGCAEIGVVGPLCGIMGSWQALEAMKIILGLPNLSGAVLMIDGVSGNARRVALARDAECVLCSNQNKRGMHA